MEDRGRGQHEEADREGVERGVGGVRGEDPAPLEPDRPPREEDAQGRPQRHLAGHPAQADRGVCGHRQHRHHDRQGQAVVQAALDVQQMA